MPVHAAQRTTEGDAATAVVLGAFRANGLLLEAGGLIAAQEGLTAARWQVLGAIELADRPLTVPQIARRMGLTRQAVQMSINRLLAAGLVVADGNPDHRRSPVYRLSERGRRKYLALDHHQARWIDQLASGLDVSELATTARVLQELSNRLESNSNGKPKRSDSDAAP